MKDILKLGIVLMVYGLIAGLSLSLVNSKTRGVIAEQDRAAKEAAIKEVLPCADFYSPDSGKLADGTSFNYLTGFKDSTKSEKIGYVVTAYGTGFSSTLITIVGLNKDLTVSQIEIIYQSETPGLGDLCTQSKDGQEPGLSKDSMANLPSA
jgi:electron transport complex protein RnfG